MKRQVRAIVCGLSLTALLAVPASAQMWGLPDFALPSAGPTPGGFVAAGYGRGLNDASGKADFFGGVIGAALESVSLMGGLGVVSNGTSEITFGGAIGVDVVRAPTAPVRVMLQAGVGYLKSGGVTGLRVPLGVALKGNIQSESATVTPWVMPRLNIVRLSGGGISATETDFGASGGLSVTLPSGFGFGAALDLLFASSEALMFGIGAHYFFGR